MKKGLVIILIFVLTLSIISSVAFTKAIPEKDKVKPIKANDIELVRKALIKGKPAGKDKPTKNVATGNLGTNGIGDKYAIIIGISDYPGTENDLNYADDDAIDANKTLVEVYGFDPANVILLTDLNANFSAIYNAIEDIKTKVNEEGDEVVFFFSGHGARGIADDGDKELIDEAIVTHDGTSELLYIWDGQLKQWFSDFNTTRIIFIFDSCLAGGMNDLKADGRIINMASSENGLSYESSELKNGVFTYYFVEEGMYNGKADIYDHDGDEVIPESSDVTIEEAFDYAKPLVEDYVSQSPTISDSFENDLLL